MSALSYYAASVRGTSHISMGLPNQDAFAVNHLRSCWSSASVGCDGKIAWPIHGGEFVVAVVADGLGSKEHPEIGSHEAASTAVTALSLAIIDRRDLSEVDDLVLAGVLQTALAAVQRKADELGVDSDELETTLAVCAYDTEGHVVWASAGDSGFVARTRGGQYRCLGTMARAGSRTLVWPLSCCAHWQFGNESEVESLILATDGILEQLVPGYVKATEGNDEAAAAEALEINEPLLDLFLNLSPEDAALPEELSAGAESFLKALDPIDVHDDKTVVILYTNENADDEDDALDPGFASDDELETMGVLESDVEDEDKGEGKDEDEDKAEGIVVPDVPTTVQPAGVAEVPAMHQSAAVSPAPADALLDAEKTVACEPLPPAEPQPAGVPVIPRGHTSNAEASRIDDPFDPNVSLEVPVYVTSAAPHSKPGDSLQTNAADHLGKDAPKVLIPGIGSAIISTSINRRVPFV